MADSPVAVVTGAGSGIGRVVARTLLGAGYRVALAGRRREALEETAGEGSTSLVVPTDVSDPIAVGALFAAVTDAWSRVDLLFNNAGTFGPIGTVDEIALDDWRTTVDTNLNGAFLCAREAFAVMRSQLPSGGRIINNGSISAHTPRPGTVAYTTTKHAITGLTKTISLDGRAYGIACGQIDIGNAATDMTQAMAAGVPQADGGVRPEPLMDVADVARAVLYMAGLPLEANVATMTVMATRMPYVGRG